jgi:Homeodomain-like domain
MSTELTGLGASSEAASVASPDQILLSETDRSRLYTFVHAGQANARARIRAQVLLKLGEGWSLVEVCRAFDVCRNTAIAVRARFADGGVDAVLRHKRQVRYRQALCGSQQAHLIAIACSPVPDGHDHWTLRMLAGKAVELGFVEKVSPETIRALLKKTRSSPGDTVSGASRR